MGLSHSAFGAANSANGRFCGERGVHHADAHGSEKGRGTQELESDDLLNSEMRITQI